MARWQHSESVESLIAAFVERLFEAVEHEIDVRSRTLAVNCVEVAATVPAASEQVTARPAPRALRTGAPLQGPPAGSTLQATAGNATAQTEAPAPRRRRRARTGEVTSASRRTEPPASPPPSPEQTRRDAEFARLRALLKPTGTDDASQAASTLSAQPALVAVAAPGDPFRLLEAEIRSHAHRLAQLPHTSCTARIAAWAGRVRSYEETNRNRVAADLLLDKLRVLARGMDAGRIDALNGSWRATDWSSYIRTNEALAEALPAGPQTPVELRPDGSGDPDYRDIWSQPS